MPDKSAPSVALSAPLAKRIISAVVLIPLVGIAVYFGGYILLGFVLLVGLLAGYEYLALLRRHGLAPSYVSTIALILFLILDAQWPAWGLMPFALLWVPLLALTIEVFRGNAPNSLYGWGLATVGGIYIGYCLSFFIRLRGVNSGFYWLALALVGTWIADTGAYAVGRRVGKHPFFPKISPKKTREGAVGGLVSGVLAVTIMGYFLLSLPIGWGIVLGTLLTLGATFGDLAESLIKRQVGVKDSGNLIPGHGGVLDRVDSLLFVVPIVYYVAVGLTHLLL